MKSKSFNLNFAVWASVLGALCSVLLGCLIFGFGISPNHAILLSCLSFSVMGAFTFALFKDGRLREGFALFALLFILSILLLGEFRGPRLIVFTIYSMAELAAIVWFACAFFERLKGLKKARPLLFSGITALFFALGALLQWVLFGKTGTPFNPFANLSFGFFLGLGLGIGFELAEVLTTARTKVP